MIRDCLPQDVHTMTETYNHYIENSTITFETVPVTVDDMSERIAKNRPYPCLVFEEQERVVGFAYAGPWNSRCAYRQTSESSIYLAPASIGKGIGGQLYRALIQRVFDLPTHCVIGGIALPNDASTALHEKLGFEKVAHFKQVGWKFDRWIDVGYWELIRDDLRNS